MTLRTFALLLVLAASVTAGLGWWWTLELVPDLDGRTPVPGLQSPVEVRFDNFAIPHVYAASSDDVWTAVGYLQARDRLWQMELYRRAASGRLSELFGEPTVATDQRFLTLGLRRAAAAEWARATPAVRSAFERYSLGVNAAIGAAGSWRLPLEFQLLRITPEPWTPVDSLSIGKLFAWRLAENRSGELLRYVLSRSLGPRVAELLPDPPSWAPTIVERVNGVNGASEVNRVNGWAGGSTGESHPAAPFTPFTLFTPLPRGLEWLNPAAHAGSNSWVVSGSRTGSGRPLLANDPHLVLEMPSVWWEAHVSGGDLDVAGALIPGIPFVLIGHNRRIGWGLTNVGADVQDFYIERLDAERRRYSSGGNWLPLRVEHFKIAVRGRPEPLGFGVRSTAHGPILDPDLWQEPRPGALGQAALPAETVLALRWEALSQGESAAAFETLARANDWAEFVVAVRRFSSPAQNFVYADVEGNIGYAMSGLLPVRAGSDGAAPVSGEGGQSEWQAAVASTDLPAVINPPSGQVVTANNEVDRRFPHMITRDWIAPFRAERITRMLGDRRGLDMPALQQMQADITSLAADRMLMAVAETKGDEPETSAALEQLRLWDRRVDGRPISTLYEVFEQMLWRRTFADEMSPMLYDRFYRYAANERFAGLHAIINDPMSAWFDDWTTSDRRETRDDMARLAAADAVSFLRAEFGRQENWGWSRLHAVHFSHALAGGGRLLDWFFSRGPVEVAGDGMTVNKTATNLREPFETTEAASYRLILDVGAWDQSIAVNTTGQSGHSRSPHYFDQNQLWREGRYHALPFSRAAVEAATVSTLELVP